MTTDLFSIENPPIRSEESLSAAGGAPLAYRMRPRSLSEFIGQDHLVAPGKLLERTIKADRLSSLILYGPPGSGKTTLATVISHTTKMRFVELNAVSSNVAELRRTMAEAEKWLSSQGEKTLIFIDEIHRFNKAQQDVLMPKVEQGRIILMGATTHNPSFSINGPLLSRSLVMELKPLSEAELIKIILHAANDRERGFGMRAIEFGEGALDHLARQASGDARRALMALEVGVLTTPADSDGVIRFTREVSQESVQKKIVHYGNGEDYHYDTASALIKSIRGSDVNAALYWLAKMLYAGEDPRFILRRLVILSSEDIGNADPRALLVAAGAIPAIEFVGTPEAQIILGHVVTYLAMAPKSNAAYMALNEALEDIKEGKIEEVPKHLRDASYTGAQRMEHGAGYQYAHNSPEHYVVQQYLGVEKSYYRPTSMGFEKVHQERLKELKDIGARDHGR